MHSLLSEWDASILQPNAIGMEVDFLHGGPKSNFIFWLHRLEWN